MSGRRGTILPLLAISLVALCGFVALAVDVGMIAVAKTQCQNAADAAALTGARTLDGSSVPNLSGATTNAQNAAIANTVLAQPVASTETTIIHGTYHYDPTSQTFAPQYTVVAPDTYDLTQVSVTHPSGTGFARIFGVNTFSLTARATAAHQPRDLSIILDYSGSMNNESDLWNCETYLGSVNNSPNSTDPLVPVFGHYTDTVDAQLLTTSSDARVGKSNVTVSVLGVPPLALDFYQQNRGATANPAFTPAAATLPENYAAVLPGDKYMMINGKTTPATTIQDITGASNSQIQQKKDAAMPSYPSFNGYTQGPAYFGKTFFIWPPDPNSANDWRQKFFSTNDNTKLWDNAGNWLPPSGNYSINYKAILTWIQNTGPNAFPPQLRAGRILYYAKIPTDVPASAYTHTNPNSNITDPDQRFWKEYIDYVIGVWRDPFGNVQSPGNPACSFGPDFTWNTIQVSAPVTYSKAPTVRMNPQDNPLRPRQRLWFGPMTMIQFMSDTKLFPGTVHDISMYPAKLGISGALQDIQNNHPNVLVSMILFSRPQYNNDPSGIGEFNQVQYSLNRDYTSMINSLWFPPGSSVSDVRLWDSNGLQTPRAFGDYTSNTATSYGFMLAYNQFSSNSTLRSGLLGGLGRKGAQRLAILETDGMANEDSIAVLGFDNQGANQSYYHILPGEALNGGGYNQNALLSVVQAICNNTDGTPGTAPGYSPNPGYPGFSTRRKPVLVHAIAFGAIFEPTASGTEQTNAIALLQQISSIGGTIFPASSSDPANGYKWAIGTLAEREAKLQQAFSKIMDNGIAVSLIQ